MPLATLIDRRFGVRTRAVPNPEATTIGTTATRILANNPNRLGFVVVNLSSNVILLSPARDVSTTNGIRLSASGGAVTLIWDEDFDMVGWEWFAIADVGGANAVYSLEIVEYQGRELAGAQEVQVITR